MLSKDEVINVANMAKLKFQDDEIDSFIDKFTDMIDLANTIVEVDTQGVKASLNINDSGHFKDYEDNETLTRQEALKNTLEDQYGYFKILKVVE